MKTQAELNLEAAMPAIDAKSEELSKKFGKVEAFAFVNENDEVVIGYLKPADRITKMRAIDMFEQSRSQAGDIILRSCLIREESDKRILDESGEFDPIYLGAIDFAVDTVKVCIEQLKKKKMMLQSYSQTASM